VSSRILAISSCTATKLETLEGQTRWAESLYAGQQHIRLMRGIKRYRAAEQPAGQLRFHILSALHGLISPRTLVSPYNHSFSGLPADTIRRQGEERNVPRDIRKTLSEPFDLGLLLLGDSYLRACDLDANVALGGPLISFCSPAAARRLPKIAELRPVVLTNAEARRFSCSLVALKGELGGRLLSRLATEPAEIDNLTCTDADVLRWLQADLRMSEKKLVAA
jgi:hypothetical protein